ncbi:flagellar basal-body MS-ring/collar protein FliF [Buchnera aphidicola]|uniref:flagellar basal-body MS-ring/collar protein FliF n=1 Tax=Buchnera aphidicola TaxID=9 RepID=UPI0031B86618
MINFKNLFFINIKKYYNNFIVFFLKNIQFFLIFLTSFFTIIIVSFFWFRADNYKILYKNLTDIEGSEIIKKLVKLKIPYKLEEKTGSILVPKKKFQTIRFELADQKNFFKKIHGFEILDKEKFGISQFNETINYQRGLEGELSETLQLMYPIKNARIHLSLPKESDFFEKKKKPSASVLLSLNSKKELDHLQISSIVQFISNSVPGLTYNDIVIVDQFGHMLNTIFPNLKNNDLFYFKKLYNLQIEKKFKNYLIKILKSLFGEKNFIVQVIVETKNFLPLQSKKKNVSFNHKKRHPNLLTLVPDYLNNFNLSQNASIYNNKNLLNRKEFQNSKNFFENLKIFNKKKTNFFLKKIQTNKQKKNNYISYLYNENNLQNNIVIDDIEKLSIKIVLNYYKNSQGDLVPFTNLELQTIKNFITSIVPFSASRGDTIKILNTLFFKKKISTFTKIFLFLKNVFFANSIIIIFFLTLIIIFYFFYHKILKVFLKVFKIKNKTQVLDVSQNSKKIFQKSNDVNILKKENVQNSHDKVLEMKNKILQMNSETIAKIIRVWFKKMDN